MLSRCPIPSSSLVSTVSLSEPESLSSEPGPGPRGDCLGNWEYLSSVSGPTGRGLPRLFINSLRACSTRICFVWSE
ncbi:hypothetical protein BJX96DRAFT_154964 [Aspergillus floccosus]